MISLRLDPKLEQNVQNTAKILGVTKSELIRKSISEYINKIVHQSPWEIGKGYFGKYSSGQGNLSTDRKIILKTKIMAKRIGRSVLRRNKGNGIQFNLQILVTD